MSKTLSGMSPEQARNLDVVKMVLSGVVCVTMLAMGFNLLLPLSSGLDTLCLLTAVASAMVFFGLADGA
jgi:hypothetical protein